MKRPADHRSPVRRLVAIARQLITMHRRRTDTTSAVERLVAEIALALDPAAGLDEVTPPTSRLDTCSALRRRPPVRRARPARDCRRSHAIH